MINLLELERQKKQIKIKQNIAVMENCKQEITHILKNGVKVISNLKKR